MRRRYIRVYAAKGPPTGSRGAGSMIGRSAVEASNVKSEVGQKVDGKSRAGSVRSYDSPNAHLEVPPPYEPARQQRPLNRKHVRFAACGQRSTTS